MRGRMDIMGKVEMQFWLRAFMMEAPIQHAQNTINADPRIKTCAVPIISEYECGRYWWQMCLCPQVDALGLKGGEGRIWVADNLTDRDAQVEECAELAGELLDGLKVHQSWTIVDTPKER
jgi:hypothetical protein